jgi:hypothetical protein
LALTLDGSQPLWLAIGFWQKQKQEKAQPKACEEVEGKVTRDNITLFCICAHQCDAIFN